MIFSGKKLEEMMNSIGLERHLVCSFQTGWLVD